jgi:hypothetical protein
MRYLALVVLAACGGDGGHQQMTFDAPPLIDSPVQTHDGPAAVAHGHAKVLNGPTTARGFTRHVASVAPENGQWLITPHQITMTLAMVSLGGGTGNMPLTPVNCPVTWDRTMPGLTELGDCTFDVPPGTYSTINVVFSTSITTLIEDDGFYSTATGVQTTAPTGGAVPYAWTIGTGFNNIVEPLGTTLTVAANDTVDLSIVLSGLQSFRATVNNGAVTPDPMRPDLVATAGTLAGINYYVSQALGTPASFCAGGCTAPPTGITAVSVYYPTATTVTMVGLQLNGTPNNCGPIMPSFIVDPKAYIGLDSSGNIGVALSGDNYSSYSALLTMRQTTNTTLYCQNSTTDPMPAGGSFASGAPTIQSAGNSQGAYVLVAQ